jgi:hypothetical protein
MDNFLFTLPAGVNPLVNPSPPKWPLVKNRVKYFGGLGLRITNYLTMLISLEIVERGEAKLYVKNKESRYFDANLSFALLALLCSAIVKKFKLTTKEKLRNFCTFRNRVVKSSIRSS